jgi:hypothetical protein
MDASGSSWADNQRSALGADSIVSNDDVISETKPITLPKKKE